MRPAHPSQTGPSGASLPSLLVIAFLAAGLSLGCAVSSQSSSRPASSDSPAGERAAPDPDPPEALAARASLVRKLAASHRVTEEKVLIALADVPRHRFFNAQSMEDAYIDRPRPIGYGQTISQPAVVGMMTQALRLTGKEHVLEIGTGSGYQAAVLSLLSAHVDSIEIVAPLGEAAKKRLAAMGYSNVAVRIGDGYLGWPDDAPFDRIILTAAPPEIPDALLRQLAEGGVLVAPVGEGREQRLVRLTKKDGAVSREDLGPILFVPMVEGDH